MSFLFGGGGSKVKPKYTGIQLQTASQTAALTISWGANRFAPNLIFYDDFKSHKQKQKAGKGGGTITDYTYTASCIFALCEGGDPATGIQGIGRVWKDQDTTATLSSLGMTLFSGTVPQAPWGYLTSNHPDKAFNYAGVAYLAVANYDLGNQATLPNHSFEVLSQRVGSGWTGGDDADCALIISDFLFNDNYGVIVPEAAVDTVQLLSTVDATTTGDNSYQTYCRAMGFGLSPTLSDQTEAGSILDKWCKITNTAIVWTGYCLRFVPYCYTTLSANGVIFVPDTEPRYELADSDYINKNNPVLVARKDPSDCHNQQKLIYSNRANSYNDAPEPWEDQGLIEQFGKRPGSDYTAKEVTVQAMAVKVVTLMGKRGAYLRNTYDFTLGGAHILLEPMDVVTVYDPALGLVPVQITKISESDSGDLKITADEISAGVSTPTTYTPQTGGTPGQNTGAAPGPVNDPIIFEPPADMTGGTAEIWAAVSGGDNTTAGQYWGGCMVYVSADSGASYQNIGRVDSPARQGKLTANIAAYGGANPDTVNTAAVTLLMSKGELQSVSSTEAANETTLCYLGGEFIAFETATLTGTNAYDLTDLYRGLHGTTPGAHTTGAPFARLDENIFGYTLPVDYVGIPLKFKFPSFNIWGAALQDLSDCDEFDYTPDGNGFKIADPASCTLSFGRRTQTDGTSIITGTVTTGASTGPYLDHYDVQVATGPSYATWIDIASISAAGTKSQFEPAIAATDYKARVRAVSAAPDGIPSDWVESAVVNSGGLESAVPNAPTALVATGGTLSNALSCTPPAAGAPVSGYRWFAIHGASGSFGSATLVGQTNVPFFLHAGLGATDTWRYWVVAYNSVGNSTEEGPQNATTGSGGGGGAVEVQDEGSVVVAAATGLNFVGSGVTVIENPSGVAEVTIPGGGGGGGGGGPSALTRIAQITLSADAPDITFTGIPDIYEDLVAICTMQSPLHGASNYLQVRFNGDTGNNYGYYWVASYGHSGPTLSTSLISLGDIPPEATSGSLQGLRSANVEIFGYADTARQKSVSATGTVQFVVSSGYGADLSDVEASGQWYNTAKINEVSFFGQSGDFKAGSTITLYGRGGTASTTGVPVTARWWRQRMVGQDGSVTADAGFGMVLVDWRDPSGTLLVGGWTPTASNTDTAGGWDINEAFDGGSGASHGWYSGNILAEGQYATSPWLAVDFGVPVTPTEVVFSPLFGFAWTIGSQQAVEYSHDGEIWQELCVVVCRPGADSTPETYALPLTPAGGGGGSAAMNGARVHLSANYNPTSGTDARMLDASSVVDYDTASWWDSANGWFVVPAGVAYVEMQQQRACFGGVNTGLRMRLNGTTVALVGDTTMNFINGVTTIAVATGDTVEPFVYGSSGYTLGGTDPAFTWASIRAVG